VKWTSNAFGHGVFVGKLYGRTQSATVVSTRLRSRMEDGVTLSDGGLDLGEYAGMILRICADGSVFEAVVRTGEYERSGVEYVCSFTTEFKSGDGWDEGKEGRPVAKFITVRAPFAKFIPAWSEAQRGTQNDGDMERLKHPPPTSDFPLDRSDVRQLGFRFRRKVNLYRGRSRSNRFYMSLSYIKVYRSQVEPEVVLVSDAGIPQHVGQGMLRHDQKEIVREGSDAGSDDGGSHSNDDDIRSEERRRAYYHFMVEQVLRNSGMTYTIVRVKAYSERQSITSAIKIQQEEEAISAVSRADVAEVCTSVLLDPRACNVCFYLSKVELPPLSPEENISDAISRLQTES